ncbi:MAG: hypothetical protein RI967_2287 [Planctomycetota bacterium]|jgi:hypothetical protein
MAIETKIQTRQTFQNIGYAVICLALGLWGWYDYAVTIPEMEAAYAEYVALEETITTLEAQKKVAPLNADQVARLREAWALKAKSTEKPDLPAAYDRPVQLWLYVIGCGVLGVPWFAYAQWQLTRRRFRLDDDGTFTADGRTYAASDLTGIDMSRWMSKSIAEVLTADGGRIALDDYKFKGVEDIVAALAARFHPGEWTSDARPIGDPKSRDTKAKLAAEADGEPSAATDAAATAGSDGDARA